MSGAPIPADEYERLLALAYHDILDTAAEASFDRITRLAARILGTPVAVLNFIDQYRQWGKSAVGLGDTTAPRHDSFCAWTILQDQPTVVEDARSDPRFQHNPMVTGAPHIYMYAGVPLITATGHRIGSLCVTDSQPHPLSAHDLQALQDLAALAVTELDLRVQQRQLGLHLGAQVQAGNELERTVAHAHVLATLNDLLDEQGPAQATVVKALEGLGQALDADVVGIVGRQGQALRLQVGYQHDRESRLRAVLEPRYLDWSGSLTSRLAVGNEAVYLDDYAAHPDALNWVTEQGVKQVAWVPLGQREGEASVLLALRLTGHPVPRWRNSDRALLTAAGQTLRAALDRAELVRVHRQQARQDSLTQVLNRRALEEDLQAWATPFTLALLDLDGFKQINDRHGHDQGDRVLRVFATTLSAAVARTGQVYRLGGDEFVVLSTLEDDEIMEQIDVAVLGAQQVEEHLGVSTGLVRHDEAERDSLLGVADVRMYAAKRQKVMVRQSRIIRN